MAAAWIKWLDLRRPAAVRQHGDSDFDAETAAEAEGMKALLESILGEDIDMSSADEVVRRVEAQYQAKFQAEDEARQARQARRGKTAKQQAREARQAAEEKEVSQSIREVYRKLASSVHPDREPDPAEKQRKTELMQRANEAYEKGNLLQLLELQLELEHIDQAHLASIRPQRLKHYIKILKGQLAELEMEIQRVDDQFAAEFGLPPFERHEPNRLLPMLLSDTAACRTCIRQLQEQLDNTRDLKRLKAWLKTITARRKDDFQFDDEIPF